MKNLSVFYFSGCLVNPEYLANPIFFRKSCFFFSIISVRYFFNEDNFAKIGKTIKTFLPKIIPVKVGIFIRNFCCSTCCGWCCSFCCLFGKYADATISINLSFLITFYTKHPESWFQGTSSKLFHFPISYRSDFTSDISLESPLYSILPLGGTVKGTYPDSFRLEIVRKDQVTVSWWSWWPSLLLNHHTAWYKFILFVGFFPVRYTKKGPSDCQLMIIYYSIITQLGISFIC